MVEHESGRKQNSGSSYRQHKNPTRERCRCISAPSALPSSPSPSCLHPKSPPCSESGWLDLLTETLHKILNSAGEAGSHLFDALWPHVQWAWNAVKDLVIKHPQIMVAVVILLLGVLLIQPLARGVVQALGFGGSGVRAMSIASQIQASLYGGYVPKGSLFSFLQSFGAL